MNTVKLGKRLMAAAGFCRKGSFIADVGTDHAHLPIYLYQKGMISGAVAADINEGPIERARVNIRANRLSDKIDTVLCDGLSKLESYSPKDVFILGMGGELIAKIIDNAPFVKDESVRLILQPMTHWEILRKYLCENGFTIVDEALVKEDRIYRIIVAEYSGDCEEYSEVELIIGRLNIERRAPLLYELVERSLDVINERIKGKLSGGADASAEVALAEKLEEIIK